MNVLEKNCSIFTGCQMNGKVQYACQIGWDDEATADFKALASELNVPIAIEDEHMVFYI